VSGAEEPLARTRIASWGAPAFAPPPPPLLLAGARLAGTPYVIGRLLGQGGMGEVYEVEHAELGRRLAVKVLHRDHVDRPDLAARLREEARQLARLLHPNLVEVTDLGVTTDGRPYFAMPRLSGRDLREELARGGALPGERAIALVAQALDGLAAAHAAGLVHRDVKLENLFLCDDGTVKVLDFGVAKVLAEGASGRTLPGASPGTPRSMAPEQCVSGAVDTRADLYAVGLALYELLTGRGPFDELRGNDHALRYAHCERTPPPPSYFVPIEPELEVAVMRALSKSRDRRFQTAAEMALVLRSLLPENAPTMVSPPSSSPRSGRRRIRKVRRPWVRAVLPALSVAFFALGVAFGHALPPPARAPDVAHGR
jgi:eukaryotic-like serine/threonine-protein kinase